MERLTRRQLVSAVTLGPLVVHRPDAAGRRGSSARPGARHFPNVVLRTHEDRPVRFYDDLLKGKTVLLTFMYATCEGVCPLTVVNLKKIHARLGDRAGRDVFLYSITIKPEQDTPRVLASYAAMHGAGPGWLFLTGAPGDIDLVRRRVGFVDADPVAARDASSHIGVILYGNEPLNRWAATPALGNPDQIYRAVRWMEGQMPGLEDAGRKGVL
jgi:protein SCO1